jgi:hypothetical protein
LLILTRQARKSSENCGFEILSWRKVDEMKKPDTDAGLNLLWLALKGKPKRLNYNTQNLNAFTIFVQSV